MVIEIDHPRAASLPATRARPAKLPDATGAGNHVARLGIMGDEIDKLEPVQRQGRVVRPKIERYPLPLGAALVLGLLALVLGRRR